jgi:proline iminopeptidase
LLRNASSLAGILDILIHGRLDLAALLVTAWELAQVWPGSDLVIGSRAGHAATDPGMSAAVMAATDRLVQVLSQSTRVKQSRKKKS